MADVEIPTIVVGEVTKSQEMAILQNSESEGPIKDQASFRKESETGEEADMKRNGNRKYSSRNGKGLPRRNGRNDRRRFQPNRSWEKFHEEGMLVTHVVSPTLVYMQTAQQQVDHQKIQECMTNTYQGDSFKPSVVASKMLLGAKVGGVFERVRTEEMREEEGSSAKQWKVLLIDRGNTVWVPEEELNFTLAGLNDIKPLAVKYTMNELRVSAEATEAAIEETKNLFITRTTDVKVDCEIFTPNRDNAVYYVDIFVGDKLLNVELTNLNAVEPKTSWRWKNQRTSTSSMEDAPHSPNSLGDQSHDYSRLDKQNNNDPKSHLEHQNGEMRESGDVRQKDGSPRGINGASMRNGNARGNRNWYGANPRRRRRSTMNVALRDWAVACYDPNTTYNAIKATTDMMTKVDGAVSRPEDVYIEHGATEVKDMVSHIKSVAHNKTNLVLLLCIPPEGLDDCGELEVAGQSLGVTVVFARGSTLAEPNPETATKLLKELQDKYKQSPAFLPNLPGSSPIYNSMENSNNRRRRPLNKFRRQQNRQRNNISNWEMRNGTDTMLTSIKDLTSSVRTMLMSSSGGDLDAPNPSQLSASLSKALQNLEDIQTNYKQTRAHCMGVLASVMALVANFSTILNPDVLRA